ncbi:MAG: inositol monophosphatase family protein [Bacteroidota bacterium]
MLTTLIQEVIALTHLTAKFIRTEYEGFDRNQVEVKSTNSLVSYVDKKAEKQLVTGLRDLLPEAGFIAEEGTGEPNPEGYNWIVDPLDGTTNFVHGIPTFSISIALIDQDENILLGVVHEVMRDETFHAIQNGGAFLNGKPIRVSDAENLSKGLIATGFPYASFARVDEYLDILKSFMQHSHGIRRIGSAAVDLAYVACGRFEGFFEYGLNSWDVAAGILLVREAGGSVTDFSGNNQAISGKEILASCLNVKAEMEAIIRREK